MAYATNAEVTQEFKSIDFAAANATVAAAQVDRFILEASAEIDGYVSTKYLLPVTPGCAGLLLLKQLCIAIVKIRIQEILALKTGNPDQQQFQGQKDMADKARMTLDRIRKGEVLLVGANLATSADGVRSFNSDTGYERKFKIDEDQW